VLVNITGGEDLTLGEVHQINDIVHDAVGDEAEIIFGAVHEPAMMGEIRVTVIATGFDRYVQNSPASGNGLSQSGFAPSAGVPGAASSTAPAAAKAPSVLPFPARERPAVRPPAPPARPVWEGAPPRPPRIQPPAAASSAELADTEIPPFIRRQMD